MECKLTDLILLLLFAGRNYSTFNQILGRYAYYRLVIYTYLLICLYINFKVGIYNTLHVILKLNILNYNYIN